MGGQGNSLVVETKAQNDKHCTQDSFTVSHSVVNSSNFVDVTLDSQEAFEPASHFSHQGSGFSNDPLETLSPIEDAALNNFYQCVYTADDVSQKRVHSSTPALISGMIQ